MKPGPYTRSPGPVAALLLLVPLASSCVFARPAIRDPTTPRHIQLDVLNNNFSDATLWIVVRESARERLGVVGGKTDTTFVIPWDFPQPIRMEIDMLAGPRCLTRAIEADPGDILQLEILAVFDETPWCDRTGRESETGSRGLRSPG